MPIDERGRNAITVAVAAYDHAAEGPLPRNAIRRADLSEEHGGSSARRAGVTLSQECGNTVGGRQRRAVRVRPDPLNETAPGAGDRC
jgi:hypothetical protein